MALAEPRHENVSRFGITRGPAAFAIAAYFIVLGSLAWRDVDAVIRVTNLLLGAAVVAFYIWRMPQRGDALDRSALGGLLLFALTCIASHYPRQSVDSMVLAILYVAALFGLRAILSREPERRLFAVGLMALSACLTLIVSVQFIVPFLEVWALSEWRVVPPLGLKVAPEPWAFRYEIALLLVMLYPSWWLGHPSGWRRAVASLVAVPVFTTVLLVGSRNLWLAIAIGGASVLVTTRRWVRFKKLGRPPIAQLVGATFALLVLGMLFIPPIVERALGLASIAERWAVWQATTAAWSAEPLTGHGPNSFPWLLQRTEWFDTHAFAPSHPDGAAIQLLAETGIVGLIAVGVIAIRILPCVLRSSMGAGRFALTTFLSFGVAANPFEFGALMTSAIVWLSLMCPRSDPPSPAQIRWSVLRWSTVIAAICVGVAVSAMTVATLYYDRARESIAGGNWTSAGSSLRLAVVLDPAQAIYARELGILHLLSGDPTGAISLIQRTTELNPQDDKAWRVLGLAASEANESSLAEYALRRAVEVQRSDPANLLMLVSGLQKGTVAQPLLAEIVQAWPEIMFAPGWEQFVGQENSSSIARAALNRWMRGDPSPQPLRAQPLFLAAIIGIEEDRLREVPARMSESLRGLYVASMRCQRADSLSASHNDQRQSLYWLLSVRQAALDGRDSSEAKRMYRLISGDPILSQVEQTHLSPLVEDGARGSSTDTWGYDRLSVDWPSSPWDLPSPTIGLVRVYVDPQAATFSWRLEECGA